MQFQSQVLTNVEVSPGYFRMRMTAPPSVLEAASGQFVMVKVSRAIDPLLRRRDHLVVARGEDHALDVLDLGGRAGHADAVGVGLGELLERG